jgi:hypothetical protein
MQAGTVLLSHPFSSQKQGRGAGSCLKARGMTDDMTDMEGWVVWNASMGILDRVTIGAIEQTETGRSACLAPPYEVVGPFNLDELETQGRITFGECMVMSRVRWQADQAELRAEAQEIRRAAFFKLDFDDDLEYRDVLKLPMEGPLDPAQINAAFRKQAKTAHPDAGGCDEDYREITEARDALLKANPEARSKRRKASKDAGAGSAGA